MLLLSYAAGAVMHQLYAIACLLSAQLRGYRGERHRSHAKGGKSGGRHPKGSAELMSRHSLGRTYQRCFRSNIDSRDGAMVAQILSTFACLGDTPSLWMQDFSCWA